MKLAALLFPFITIASLQAGDSLWPLDPKEVPRLDRNQDIFGMVSACVDLDSKGQYNNERIIADHALATYKVETQADAQAAGLDAFPGGTRPEFEMDAAAELQWCLGSAYFSLCEFDKAKPILQKVWEHY